MVETRAGNGANAPRLPVYAAYLRSSRYRDNVDATAAYLDGRLSITRLIQSAGAYPDPPLPCFNFQVLLEGNGPLQVDLGGGPWAGYSKPGQVFIASANVATDYRVGFDHSVLCVGVDASLMQELCETANLPVPNHLFGPWTDPKTSGLLDALLELLDADGKKRPPRSDQTILSLLTSIAWSVSHDGVPSLLNSGAPLDRDRIDAVRRFVMDDLDQRGTVSAMAEHLNVDRFRLARATQHYFGCSPAALLRAWRVERAVALVETTDTPLSDIAAACGFSDQAHMTRVFKSVRGETPGRVRKRRPPS